MNLAAIDLNLLVTFDALLSEGSVGAAATRIGLSQPAMSKRLSRLRTLFRDDLLVRSSTGSRATERALAISDSARSELLHIEESLGAYARFQPGRSCRTVLIAPTDLIAATLMPLVIARLRMDAPPLSIILRA